MRESVTGFRAFTALFEGVVPEFYVDNRGLVTCAIGDLVDPVEMAYPLQWLRRSDGQRATPEEILAEWTAVKTGRLAWYAHRPPRPLYLSDDGINAVFGARLAANEAIFRKRWSNWDACPAAAQRGCHSNGWAAGAGWHAPAFDAAVATMDFRACAGPQGDANDPRNGCRGHAWLRDAVDVPVSPQHPYGEQLTNPGLRPRNLANKALFWEAAVCLADGWDLNVINYPTEIDG